MSTTETAERIKHNHYDASDNRRHMAELVLQLTGDLWLQYQEATDKVPEVSEGVALNQSFKVVQALVSNGYPEVGHAVAALVQTDLRSVPATV